MRLTAYKLISPSIYADVRAALAKHGLELVKSSASINEDLGEISLKFTARDTAMSESPDAIRWKSYAHIYYGLNPAWLNAEFTFRGTKNKVLGLLHTRSEKCISIEREGKKMVCTPNALKAIAVAAGLPPVEPIRATAGNVIREESAEEMRKRLGA